MNSLTSALGTTAPIPKANDSKIDSSKWLDKKEIKKPEVWVDKPIDSLAKKLR